MHRSSTCFHSKVRLGETDAKRGAPEVLGLPLRFTVNPRTREIDYVYATPDLVSFSAFTEEGVRRTAWGEPFSHILPLHLDGEHFEAALPILSAQLRSMCARTAVVEARARRLRPVDGARRAAEAAVHRVVLLSPTRASTRDALLDAYTSINRLLIALAAKWPQLRAAVGRRARAFIAKEEARTKEAEPNLGTLIPLLALAGGTRWADLAWPLLDEMLDRGVLWACREHPELAATGERWEADGCTDEQRLQWMWEGAARERPAPRLPCRLPLDAGEAPRRRARRLPRPLLAVAPRHPPHPLRARPRRRLVARLLRGAPRAAAAEAGARRPAQGGGGRVGKKSSTPRAWTSRESTARACRRSCARARA